MIEDTWGSDREQAVERAYRRRERPRKTRGAVVATARFALIHIRSNMQGRG